MSTLPEFKSWSKISRLSRDCIVTEKIDGTNAQIHITADGEMFVGSRTRWITPEKDNFGFALWCKQHKDELMKMGPGTHYGEWWGLGIQRGYDIFERRFTLFGRIIATEVPSCVSAVPVLYEGIFDTNAIERVIDKLRLGGSVAALGYMKPEGIVIYHKASGQMFKKTLENDEAPKGAICQENQG